MEDKNYSIRKQPPFRFDTVGSLIRPTQLEEAWKQMKKGEISRETLYDVQTDAIVEVIEKQKAHGLKCISDGEFRREYWHMDFIWGLNGTEETYDTTLFRSWLSDYRVVKMTGPLSCGDHPFIEYFRKLHELAGDDLWCRYNAPSPTQCVLEVLRGSKDPSVSSVFGDNKKALFNNIAETYIDYLQKIYSAGCRFIQFDDCTFCYLSNREFYYVIEKMFANSYDETIGVMVELTNKVLDSKPSDMVIVEHFCGGPAAETWEMNGGYNTVSKEFLPYLHLDGFHMRMLDDNMTALRYVPEDKMISLGIINTLSSEMEDKDTLINKVLKAGDYHPLDNMGINTQCGFSYALGHQDIVEKRQWEKIDLMREVAEAVWGEQ